MGRLHISGLVRECDRDIENLLFTYQNYNGHLFEEGSNTISGRLLKITFTMVHQSL